MPFLTRPPAPLGQPWMCAPGSPCRRGMQLVHSLPAVSFFRKHLSLPGEAVFFPGKPEPLAEKDGGTRACPLWPKDSPLTPPLCPKALLWVAQDFCKSHLRFSPPDSVSRAFLFTGVQTYSLVYFTQKDHMQHGKKIKANLLFFLALAFKMFVVAKDFWKDLMFSLVKGKRWIIILLMVAAV